MGPTDEHRLTLIHLISRSNLLPNAFNWEIFEKLIFLKLINSKNVCLDLDPNLLILCKK